MRMAPPLRTSSSHTGFVNPLGPHHSAMCRLSVHTLKTSSLGASNTRVTTRSHFEDSVGALLVALIFVFCADMLLLLFLIPGIFLFEFPQIIIQPVKTLLPEAPVVFHPSRNILQRASLQPARPP